MKNDYDLQLQILTRRPMDSSADAMHVLDLIRQLAPDFMPERYDFGTPVRRPYDEARVKTETEQSCGYLIWERRKPPALGHLMPERYGNPKFASVNVSADLESTDMGKLVTFLQRVSAELNADLAFLELLRGTEIQRGAELDTVWGSSQHEEYSFFVATHMLLKGLPDLTWATVLGPAYVQHFGRERVLTAPAHLVQEIGPDTIYLQISADIQDVELRFDAFDTARQQVKEHLGLDSFYLLGVLAEEQKCRVPDFNWDEFRVGWKRQFGLSKPPKRAEKRGRQSS